MEQQQEQGERLVAFGIDITPAPWPPTALERITGALWRQLEGCREQLAEAHAELRAGTARHEAQLLATNVGAGAAIALAVAGVFLGVDQLAELVR